MKQLAKAIALAVQYIKQLSLDYLINYEPGG